MENKGLNNKQVFDTSVDEITTNKRKTKETTAELSKKKKVESQNGGAFSLTEIPGNIFAVGDDVFVTVSSIEGVQRMHIRRYKKYGERCYPTKEGVTLTPWWFEHLFSCCAPVSQHKLEIALTAIVSKDFTIKSDDFRHFAFPRNLTYKNGEIYNRNITITDNHWNEINTRLDNIVSIALDYIFRDMDFTSAFETVSDNVIPESLPESSDISAGTQYITRLLLDIVCELLKENGLCEPELFDNDIIGCSNSEADFNTAALHLEVNEIANLLRERLWIGKRHLLLPPYEYVSKNFLKSVKFDELIREARKHLCPPCFE